MSSTPGPASPPDPAASPPDPATSPPAGVSPPEPAPRFDLSRLLAPASVIVVGATDRPGSYAAQTLLNLRRAGYPGPVVGVHPRRTEVLGAPCRPTLEDAVELLGGPADAVVIATPAAGVTGYLDTAGRLGCGGTVVYAAGFGETGAVAAQADLVTTAQRHGLALLGPNGNGFVAVGARAPLWGDAVILPEQAGPIALITQSGNVGVLALAHRAGLGLHTVVSLGNAAVVQAPDVLSRLAQTSGVRAVALYLEDDGPGPRLAEALAACAQADVRVAVLKAGRSAAGREAAGAHTAALAGDHRVFAALIEEAGGVLVRDPHELLETARALAFGRRSAGGLAVLTASGGDAAIAADLAADTGVPLAELAPATRERLADLLPHTATVTNPLDHTNLVWADTAAIAGLTVALAEDPQVGTVIYVQDEPPGLPEVDAAEWAATRAGAELGGHRAGTATLLVATLPGQEPPGAISGMRAALLAVAALRRPAPDPKRLAAIAGAGRGPGRNALVRAGWLAEHEAKAVLATAGIPVPAGRIVQLALHPSFDLPKPLEDKNKGHQERDACSVTEARVEVAQDEHRLAATARTATVAGTAVEVAAAIGFPVALKLSAPGLLHKSESGALALNLPDAAAVRAAAEHLLRLLTPAWPAAEHPPAPTGPAAEQPSTQPTPSGPAERPATRPTPSGPAAERPSASAVLLVERMADPGVELVLAARRDGVVPALVIGLGGIWAEALDDVVVLPLPVEPDQIVQKLYQLRAKPLLLGTRGRPPLDLQAVAEIGHRIGSLLLAEGFTLIEVNPLIVTSDSAIAVDALIHC